MALLAKYEFSDRSSLDSAVSLIRKEIGGGGVDQYGDYLEITSHCPKPQRASEICRAYGGRPA